MRRAQAPSASLAPLLAGLVAIAVFLPSLGNGFVDWDDPRNLLDNLAYRGLGPEQLRWMWTTFHLGPYQPLSWMSYGLDYLLWGMRPLGYHLTSVLLHGLGAGLFTALALRLRPGSAFALLAGALWALHPLRVEAVSWATERREVLSGALALAALLLHARGRRAPAALAAVAAMLAKGTAVVLPALLLLLDLHGGLPWRIAWRRHLPLLGVAAVLAAVAVAGQRQAQALASLAQVGLLDRLLLFAHNLGFYVGKTLWPVSLAPLYELSQGPVQVRIGAALSLALLGLAVAAAVRLRARAALLLLAAYVVLVAPVGGLLQAGTQVAADRYAYAPGWALSLLLASGIARILPDGRRLLACAAVLVLPLALLTVRQQRIWRDTESLWTHQLAHHPDTAMAHYALALRRVTHERTREADLWAEPHFREAIRLEPGKPEAYRGLANVLRRTGRVEEAAEVYARGLGAAPEHGPLLYGLALARWEQGRREEALHLLRRLTALPPPSADSHLLLARALAAQGDVPGAVAAYERARAAPTDAPAVAPMELAWLLSTHPDPRFRDGRRAVELAREAARLGAELQARGGLALRRGLAPRLLETEAAALAEAGDFEGAAEVLRRGADPDPAWLASFARRQPIRWDPSFP